jgi:hypothetical protein
MTEDSNSWSRHDCTANYRLQVKTNPREPTSADRCNAEPIGDLATPFPPELYTPLRRPRFGPAIRFGLVVDAGHIIPLHFTDKRVAVTHISLTFRARCSVDFDKTQSANLVLALQELTLHQVLVEEW